MGRVCYHPCESSCNRVALDSAVGINSVERFLGDLECNTVPTNIVWNPSRRDIVIEVTQRLVDLGATASPNKFKETWDFNPGIGGPILRDRLWFYYTFRAQGSRVKTDMFYNQNEFLPNVYTYVPANGQNGASARPALSLHGDWWDSQLRLTWQVNSKNKVAGTWDQQAYCRCPSPPNVVPILSAPEAFNERRFAPQRLIHGEWWSPLTSKVLIEVVALHRTERWGFMALKPTDQGGSLKVTPEQYALYPSMIGVTQTSGTAGVPNGFSFHGPAGTFSNNWNANYTYRWAVSYITGGHAFKVGGQDSFGYAAATTYLPTLDTLNRPVRYRFASQNTPDQVTVFQTPYTTRNHQNHDFGLFAQDRWTMDRLTLSGGLRFDWFNSSVPAQDLTPSTLGRPAIHFDETLNTLNWRDVTPRMGVSYDVQGDGKTAVKVTLNKYVAGQVLGGLPTSANPISRLTNSNSRTWNDVNGNRVVDCDLLNPAINGECTNAGSASFVNGALPINPETGDTSLADRAIRSSADGGALWNTRGYNWEFSLGVQREIMPRVSVDVSYFRRWFGNFTTTDDLARAATDFTSFDVVAPLDSRLPGGGGNTITGYVDANTAAIAARTAVNKVLLTDSIGANQIQRWNGVDVSVNARLQNGLLLQGGTSTGRTSTNNCEVAGMLPETLGSSPRSFCEVTEPFLTQAKVVAAYTLPRYARLPATLAEALQNIQVAGTFQSIPGSFMAATYTEPNAEINQAPNPALGVGSTLGRNISNASNKSISLIAPGSVVDNRQNQLDVRVGKILRFGRTRTSLNFDVYNVTNANTVLTRNNALSKTAGDGTNNQVLQGDNRAHTLWVPTSILQARFFKISATFDF